MDRIAAEIQVEGRVQGVFYRAFVESAARELGLSGFCRNLENGAVFVWAEGDREGIEGLIGRLRTGPPAARVTDVRVAWKTWTGTYEGFSIRR